MLKIWDNIKAWFNRSQVIFLARLQVFAGFVFGILTNLDWTTVQTWDFTTPRQTMWLAVILVVNGIITEIARRAGTVTTTRDQLVPDNLADKVQVKK